MEFVSSRELRLHPAEVWQKLEKKKALVITSNGKPVGLLSDIPEGDPEEALRLLRRLRAQMALSQIRRYAKARGLDRLSRQDIDREVKAVRRRRHQ